MLSHIELWAIEVESEELRYESLRTAQVSLSYLNERSQVPTNIATARSRTRVYNGKRTVAPIVSQVSLRVALLHREMWTSESREPDLTLAASWARRMFCDIDVIVPIMGENCINQIASWAL